MMVCSEVSRAICNNVANPELSSGQDGNLRTLGSHPFCNITTPSDSQYGIILILSLSVPSFVQSQFVCCCVRYNRCLRSRRTGSIYSVTLGVSLSERS